MSTLRPSGTATGTQFKTAASNATATAASTANPTANATTAFMSSKPTLIVYPDATSNANNNTIQLRFLIMDAPRQHNLHLYIKECKRYGVTDIVRVCEPTYASNTTELSNAGIALHDMAYDDGTSPPDAVLDAWLDIVESRMVHPVQNGSKTKLDNGSSDRRTDTPTIAVHCIAGLGRAPVLVAIALMEYGHLDAVFAVTLIRKLRRGAINRKQLTYLEQYKCRRTRHRNRNSSGANACCVVM